jgi:hypothetical protein
MIARISHPVAAGRAGCAAPALISGGIGPAAAPAPSAQAGRCAYPESLPAPADRLRYLAAEED